MSSSTRKAVLKIQSAPGKIRRVWKIKPKTRVHTATRKDKLLKIREREAKENQ